MEKKFVSLILDGLCKGLGGTSHTCFPHLVHLVGQVLKANHKVWTEIIPYSLLLDDGPELAPELGKYEWYGLVYQFTVYQALHQEVTKYITPLKGSMPLIEGLGVYIQTVFSLEVIEVVPMPLQ